MDERQAQILEILDENYGEIGSGLNFHTPFELLVATILSAQSTDVRVNMVTPGLFAKYPTAFEMSQVSEEALARDINSIGLYRNKSKSIIKRRKCSWKNTTTRCQRNARSCRSCRALVAKRRTWCSATRFIFRRSQWTPTFSA